MTGVIDFETGQMAGRRLSQARQDAFRAAEEYARAGRIDEALDLYLLLVFLDGTGGLVVKADDGLNLRYEWEERLAVQGAGILKAIAKSASWLDLNSDALFVRYITRAEQMEAIIASLSPPFTARQIWGRALPDLLSWIETGTRWRPRHSP